MECPYCGVTLRDHSKYCNNCGALIDKDASPASPSGMLLPTQDENIGRQLGNYRLLSLLGEGGFAKVYRGKHIYLGTDAAIKLLHTRLAGAKEMEEFLREARTIAPLKHPHIVGVLEFGVQEGTPFLVMQYAPKGSLRTEHPKGSQLDLWLIQRYVDQLTDALQYAHDQKVVHRDVKPENMLLNQDEKILLGDFGIAQVAQSSRYGPTQGVAGTVFYMAPEQLNGKPLPASDLYSLGIVVYEWIAGERPFQGSFGEIASQQMFVPPPSLCEKIPSLPRAVEEVIFTALAKDPKDRFASMQAFARAFNNARQQIGSGGILYARTLVIPQRDQLAQLGTSTPSGEVAPGQTGPLPPPTPAGQKEALSDMPVLEPLPMRPNLPKGTSPANHPASPPPIPGTLTSGIIRPPAPPSPISPPVEEAIQPGTSYCIYHHHAAEVQSVEWLPDGKYVMSVDAAGAVHIWDSRSGERLFTHPAQEIVLSPTRERFALIEKGGSIQIWSPTAQQAMTTYSGHTARVNTLAWSPDGARIASGSRDHSIQIWDVFSGASIGRYSIHVGEITALTWTTDGKRVISADATGKMQAWDLDSKRTAFSYTGHAAKVSRLIWSPDGKRLASVGDDGNVRLWDVARSKNLVTLSGHPHGDYIVAWSPDSTRIATTGTDQTGPMIRVWKSLTGALLITYRKHSGKIHALAWSPDGSHIASGSKDGEVQVWNAATGAYFHSYKYHQGRVNAVAWSPDGKRIASADQGAKIHAWHAEHPRVIAAQGELDLRMVGLYSALGILALAFLISLGTGAWGLFVGVVLVEVVIFGFDDYLNNDARTIRKMNNIIRALLGTSSDKNKTR